MFYGGIVGAALTLLAAVVAFFLVRKSKKNIVRILEQEYYNAKKRIACLTLLLLLSLLALAGCTETDKALVAGEMLSLGENFLLQLDYEQAIVHFLAVIAIEPKNDRAYVLLADAYELAGRPKSRQAALEMSFAILRDNELIVEKLLEAMIDNNDAAAVGRLFTDMQRTGSFISSAFEGQLQSLVDAGNVALLEQIFEALYELDSDSILAVILEIWITANMEFENDEERFGAIMQILTQRYNLELAAGEEFYLGGYDEEGRRHGFGIVFYREGVKPNSVMYIGYWEENLRSGHGIATGSGGEFLDGNWENDLPNGWATYSFNDGTRDGYFRDGLGYGEVNTYDRFGNLMFTDIIAQTSVNQTFEPRPDIFGFRQSGEDEVIDGCECTHLSWDVGISGQ